MENTNFVPAAPSFVVVVAVSSFPIPDVLIVGAMGTSFVLAHSESRMSMRTVLSRRKLVIRLQVRAVSYVDSILASTSFRCPYLISEKVRFMDDAHVCV